MHLKGYVTGKEKRHAGHYTAGSNHQVALAAWPRLTQTLCSLELIQKSRYFLVISLPCICVQMSLKKIRKCCNISHTVGKGVILCASNGL